MTLGIPSPSADQNPGPVVCGLSVSLLSLTYTVTLGKALMFLGDEGKLTVEMICCVFGFCAEYLVFPSLKNSKNVTGAGQDIGGRTD